MLPNMCSSSQKCPRKIKLLAKWRISPIWSHWANSYVKCYHKFVIYKKILLNLKL